jgi:C-terminal peptidase prc
MRRLLSCSGLLLIAVGGAAAPISPDAAAPPQPSPTAQQRSEAFQYAEQVTLLAHEIERYYVRPVEQADLIHAALAGLYETVRHPIPSSLRAEIDRAKKDGGQLRELVELRELVARHRLALGDPEPLRGPGALLASARGMMRVLDPHSGIITGEELRRGSGADSRPNFGLEVELGSNPPHRILSVHPGGPAQRAGVRPGDEMLLLEGKLLLSEMLLRGNQPFKNTAITADAGAELTLTIRRASSKEPWKVKLRAENFKPETVFGVVRQDDHAWDYWLDRQRKIAHVRLGGLEEGSAEELRQVVRRLQESGLRGLLLDLRWCPGGYLSEALGVAEIFLGECTIATVKSRVQGGDTYRSVKDDGKVLDIPIVVLVNAETSGGAELIAAALQDNGRAVVAGQRTRGKASIQTTHGLPIPNTGLKLTTGTFYRPSGKNLHRFPDSKPGDDWGVRPESKLEFRISAELNRQLKDWWQLQTLRPGPSREVLPLDDPKADPQRYAALQALAGLLR